MAEQNKSVSQQKGGHGPMRGLMPTAKAKDFKKSAKRLILSLKGNYTIIILAFAFAIISTVLNIIAPNLIESLSKTIITGEILGNIDMTKVAHYAIILLCIYVIGAIFNAVQGFFMARVAATVTKGYRRDISKKINRLPLGYFDRNTFGDTLSRITNDVDTLGQSLSDSLSSTISSVTMIVGAVIMMFV